MVSTQAPPHLTLPPAQARAHMPPWHTWPGGQAPPHVPQLARSLMVSTQLPLQRVMPEPQITPRSAGPEVELPAQPAATRNATRKARVADWWVMGSSRVRIVGG